MATKRQKLSITLEAEIVKRVERLAKLAKTNRSRMLEELVMDAIEQTETNLKLAVNPAVMQAMMSAFSQPGVLRGFADAVRADLSDDQMRLFQRALDKSGLAPSPVFKRKRGKLP
jgi:predicted transcriptional regulator